MKPDKVQQCQEAILGKVPDYARSGTAKTRSFHRIMQMMPVSKHKQYSASWHAEYTQLEYSVANDAVVLFHLFLVSKRTKSSLV